MVSQNIVNTTVCDPSDYWVTKQHNDANKRINLQCAHRYSFYERHCLATIHNGIHYDQIRQHAFEFALNDLKRIVNPETSVSLINQDLPEALADRAFAVHKHDISVSKCFSFTGHIPLSLQIQPY